jgi:hypothetical protein
MQAVLDAELRVVATHSDDQDVADPYPGCLVVRVPNGMALEFGEPVEVSLEALQASACEAIDAKAEKLRNTVLTPGAGQMAAYQAKEAQARALLADDTPTEAEYPDIYNEIGITADSAGEVAIAVLAAAEKWRAYGRLVERTRLAGKKAVAEARDVAAVIAAREAVTWPG